MITKREVAQRLDISIEMATRHGIPGRMSDADFTELEANPPAWLVQSRANRRPGARPVWMQLSCNVCGFTETLRPKKWWPEFTYLSCLHHSPADLAPPTAGHYREEVHGVGSRFVGLVDRDESAESESSSRRY
jgi:hypothetical protein